MIPLYYVKPGKDLRETDFIINIICAVFSFFFFRPRAVYRQNNNLSSILKAIWSIAFVNKRMTTLFQRPSNIFKVHKTLNERWKNVMWQLGSSAYFRFRVKTVLKRCTKGRHKTVIYLFWEIWFFWRLGSISERLKRKKVNVNSNTISTRGVWSDLFVHSKDYGVDAQRK